MATVKELVRVIERQFGGERCINPQGGVGGLWIVKDRLKGGHSTSASEYAALLEQAATEGKLIIERIGEGRSSPIVCVRTPDKLQCKRRTPIESEADMAGRSRRSIKETTYPKTGDNKDIPAHLPDSMVGPVTHSAKHQPKTLDTAYTGLYCFGQSLLGEAEACEVIRGALAEIMDPDVIPLVMPKEVLDQLSGKSGKLVTELKDGTRFYRIPELTEEQKEPEVAKLTGTPNLAEALDNALGEIVGLRRELEELQSRPPECNHGDLDKKLREAAELGLQYKAEAEELEGKIDTLNRAIEQRQEKITELQGNAERMVQQGRADRTTIEGLRIKNAQDAEAHTKQVAELRVEIEDLRRQLKQAETTAEELEAKLKGGGQMSDDTAALYEKLMSGKKS